MLHEYLVASQGVVSIVFTDLERLKWFNDVFGHKTADGFIVAAIESYRHGTRSEIRNQNEASSTQLPILFRIQGDEVLLFVCGEEEVTRQQLDAVFAPVTHTGVDIDGNERTDAVTASYGLQVLRASDITADTDLLKLFDEKLSEADHESEMGKAEGLINRIKSILKETQVGLESLITSPTNEEKTFRLPILAQIREVLDVIAEEMGSLRLGKEGTKVVNDYIFALGKIAQKLEILEEIMPSPDADIHQSVRLNKEDFATMGMLLQNETADVSKEEPKTIAQRLKRFFNSR